MKLTAMVSLYNSGRFVDHRIRNLLETDIYKRGELLIYLSNAGSADPRDKEIGEQAAQQHQNVIYDEIEHCTVYATWNHIIRNSESTYLTNANTDDIVVHHAYDTLIETLERQDGDIAYSFHHTSATENVAWNQALRCRLHRIYPYDPNTKWPTCGHAPVWKRELHDVVGLFDPTMKALGDADFWLRCWVNGRKNFILIPHALYCYFKARGHNLWHRSNRRSRHIEIRRMRSRPPGFHQF